LEDDIPRPPRLEFLCTRGGTLLARSSNRSLAGAATR